MSVAKFCFAAAAALLLYLILQGCSPMKAISTTNNAVSETTRVAMPRWDASCKSKATACNKAGNKTREECPELVRCEKDQDAAYAAANGIHAAAAAAALAVAAGKDPDLAAIAKQVAARAAVYYELLKKAGFLEVLP